MADQTIDAPAAGATGAPATTATPAVTLAPAAESAGATPVVVPKAAPPAPPTAQVKSPAAAPEVKAAAPAAADAFSYEQWDGTIEALPETDRTVAQNVAAFFEKKMEGLTSDNARLQMWYDAWGDGTDISDVEKRSATLAKDVDKWKGDATKFQAEATEYKTKYADLEKQVEAWIQETGTEFGDWFQNEYKDVLSNPTGAKLFEEMLKADIDATCAAEAIKLGPDGVEVFLDKRNRWKNDEAALEYAKQAVGGGAQPNPSIDIVAGAHRQQRPTTQRKTVFDYDDPDDMVNHVAKTLSRQHGI